MSHSAHNFDVIVIGVGVMGAYTCLALAKRGLRVLGLDQHSIPNTLGSSHGHTRMTRSAYFEHPDYVPLIQRANHLWLEIEEAYGSKIIDLSGAIYIGRPESELITGSIRAADTHKLEYRVLTSVEVAAQYPQFQVGSDMIGLWERDAGTIFAEKAVTAIVSQALAHGVALCGCEKVKEWQSASGKIKVETDRATYTADRLILCAGPWTPVMLRKLGVELTITRQVIGWVWPNKPQLFQLDKLCPFAVDDGAGSLHYGFPILPGAPGIKVASHAHGSVTSIAALDRHPTRADEATFRPFVESTLPDAAGPTLAMRVCPYTNSPDNHFILDRLPGRENITIACGFSGHGFKFAPVIGEALADIALDGKSDLRINFLSLRRFL